MIPPPMPRRRPPRAVVDAGGIIRPLPRRGGLGKPPVIPRLAEAKPVRLQIGLNLDVELELKARLQGDISLTLLYVWPAHYAPHPLIALLVLRAQ